MTRAVPGFADWSQVTGRASGGAAKTSEEATIGGVRAPLCNDCAGRGRDPTAGLKQAPAGSVDPVLPGARRLRTGVFVTETGGGDQGGAWR